MKHRVVRRIPVAKRPTGSTCPQEVRRGPASCALPGRAFTSRRLRLELLERDFLRRYTEKNLRTVNFFMLSSIAPRPAARSRRAGGRASLAHPRPGSARAGTRAGEPDAVALGADAGCEHKGQASRATGPGPRIAPAAPSPPARSTSSRQSAPPIDYAQRRADQTESASAPRLHAQPPISVHSKRSFLLQSHNPQWTTPPSPRPPPPPPISSSRPAQGRRPRHRLQSAPVAHSSFSYYSCPRRTAQCGVTPPTSPPTATAANQRPRPCVPNQPLLLEARCSGPVSGLVRLSCCVLLRTLLSIWTPQFGIMLFFAEQNFND